MVLRLTLATGEEIEVPFDTTTALTVTTIKNIDGQQVETVEAHADIVGVELVEGEAEPQAVVTQMTPEEAVDAQVPISENPDSQVGAGASSTAGGDGNANPQPDQPTPDDGSDPTVAPPDADAVPDVPEHDDAVANAAAAVDAAASGATADYVQAALDDVDAALAVYPDSTQLQDAKAQLELQLGTRGA